MRGMIRVAGCALMLAGCSTQAWYEGLRENERMRCRSMPDVQAAERCLHEVEQRGYEDYRREREALDAAKAR